MEPESPSYSSILQWGIATRALVKGTLSGDQYVVHPHAQGVLVAVMDGLGHGDDAAFAAERAASTLREHAHEPIVLLLKRCHEALQGTRGAVMSLASFHAAAHVMSWAGVGDVEGVLIHTSADHSESREYVQQRGAVLGFRLPPVTPKTVTVMPGDTLIFATDGVSRNFADEPVSSAPPSVIASRLLERYAKGTDDALVLVARYGGVMP